MLVGIPPAFDALRDPDGYVVVIASPDGESSS